MNKPKISPTELAKFIALFDVDDTVDKFVGRHGMIADHHHRAPEHWDKDATSQSYVARQYVRRRFSIPGEIVNKKGVIDLIIWAGQP